MDHLTARASWLLLLASLHSTKRMRSTGIVLAILMLVDVHHSITKVIWVASLAWLPSLCSAPERKDTISSKKPGGTQPEHHSFLLVLAAVQNVASAPDSSSSRTATTSAAAHSLTQEHV